MSGLSSVFFLSVALFVPKLVTIALHYVIQALSFCSLVLVFASLH